jgi:hypothetical protein
VQHDYSKLSKSGYIHDTQGKQFSSQIVNNDCCSESDIQSKVLDNEPALINLNGDSVAGKLVSPRIQTTET